MVLTPPPLFRVRWKLKTAELPKNCNTIIANFLLADYYVITSSVLQVRIPKFKFVRVLYCVRSVFQRFWTLLLDISALCDLNSFFYSLCLNHAAECQPKRIVGPKMAVFRPLHRGKNVAKRCWNISRLNIYVLCLSSYSEIQQKSKDNSGPRRRGGGVLGGESMGSVQAGYCTRTFS